jgi:hypothetical protein
MAMAAPRNSVALKRENVSGEQAGTCIRKACRDRDENGTTMPETRPRPRSARWRLKSSLRNRARRGTCTADAELRDDVQHGFDRAGTGTAWTSGASMP